LDDWIQGPKYLEAISPSKAQLGKIPHYVKIVELGALEHELGLLVSRAIQNSANTDNDWIQMSDASIDLFLRMTNATIVQVRQGPENASSNYTFVRIVPPHMIQLRSRQKVDSELHRLGDEILKTMQSNIVDNERRMPKNEPTVVPRKMPGIMPHSNDKSHIRA
jgi:hypothetical protein